MRSSILCLGLASLASAHFLVNYPPSVGFDDDKEGDGPCGGFTPDLSDPSKLVDFHAGGDAIALMYTHPTGTWLFRVTDDASAEDGWTQIFPIVRQTGIGDFCEPQITVPDKYVGKPGVLGAVVNAPDGVLYQCMAVNFVDGVNSNIPSSCKNASIKVEFTDDPTLTALLGDTGSSSSSPSSSSNKSSSASATKSSTPSASPSHNAAAVTLQGALSLWTVALVGGALLL